MCMPTIRGVLLIFFILQIVPVHAVILPPPDRNSEFSLVAASNLSASFIIATYVANKEQERAAGVLIKSIRTFGSAYRDCPVYVVLADSENCPGKLIASREVGFIPIRADERILKYPLAIKALAAARVEELVDEEVHTIAWFDPETIVLGSLNDLDLQEGYTVAVRPVFLVNTIGLAESQDPDEYWYPIFKETNLLDKKVPVVNTVIDETRIKAYFNCEIFSIDPHAGILKEWARIVTMMVMDSTYQREVCTTFLRRLFLHQAILSAVIVSRTNGKKVRWLPLTCGYPLHSHMRMPVGKRIKSLDDLSCAILEDLWKNAPDWIKMIDMNPELKEWLNTTYLEYYTNKTDR